VPDQAQTDDGEDVEVPFDKVRAAIARRMTLSVTTKPHVTLHTWAAADALEQVVEDLSTRHGRSLRLLHALSRIVANALSSERSLNGWVREGGLTIASTVNLGVAIQTQRGLVTPVICDAARLPFLAVVERFDDLVTRARAGKLHPKEFSGGTFTISSLGGNRVEHFTPFINPPQIAILGIGRVRTMPVWSGADWDPVQELPLSLTFDHAAVDGQPAAQFLDHLIGVIEKPPDEIFQ
jgi:pyruvate dehydrogenase E2 component (dihydrolipoamide acetyltransferase)